MTSTSTTPTSDTRTESSPRGVDRRRTGEGPAGTRRRRSVGLGGLSILLGIGLLATSTSPATGATQPPKAPRTGFFGKEASAATPKTGGTLTVASPNDPSGFDPIKITIDGTVGLSEMSAVYDALVRYDPVTDKFVPQLAQAVTPSADFKTWTIKLRSNVKFTDGTPLDAAAVKFNIERFSGPDSIQYYAPIAALIDGIDTPDAATVVVRLKSPYPRFSWMLTQGFGLVGSPTAIKKQGAADFNLHPVGAGPFMFGKYTPNQDLVLDRNPNYWGGQVRLDHLRMIWPTSGDNGRLQALQSNDVDAAYIVEPKVTLDAEAKGYPGFREVRAMYSTILMNGRKGKRTSDVRVRQAISYAIDPRIMNDRVYAGKGNTSKELFPPSSRWYPSVAPLPFDLNKAKALVTEVKATGWDGSIGVICSNSPQSQAQCLAIQALLNAAGFKVNLRTTASISEFLAAIYVKFDYEVASSGLAVTDAEPWAQLVQEISGAYSPDGYDNPEMNTALDELRQASTPSAGRGAMNKVQTIWNKTVPEVPYSYAAATYVWDKDVHGIVPTAQSGVLYAKAWKG